MKLTRHVLEALRAFESPNVTFIDPDDSWPIVWERARGVWVWDLEGRRYLDLTGAFGVAAVGHANPAVVAAGKKQMGRLLHAMGDVHPHPLKAELVQKLSALTFERWNVGSGKTILCNSGFEAVEAALKTALLATRRPGILAFEGAYHGLGYGALNATHRSLFRRPFLRQLAEFGSFVPFPLQESDLPAIRRRLQRQLARGRYGAVLLEPVQARGGIRVPPAGFLPALRKLCDEHGALLILDEIYTGFGRTGYWFACEHSGVVPDLICLGKALTGGFPLSACVGQAGLMDRAWPVSTGEAWHTSTFLGHPVGCAMALANIEQLEKRRLPEHSRRLGAWLLERLSALETPPGFQVQARGLGLMAGIELRHQNGAPATQAVISLMKRMLADRFLLLPEGAHSEVLSFTPPLIISRRELDQTVAHVQRHLSRL